MTASRTILEEHRSPDGFLRLFVERDAEGDITIGFRNSDWHTHADVEAGATDLPADHALRTLIGDILADRMPIGIERRRDGAIDCIWPTSSPADELSYRPADHTVEFRLWSGRSVALPWRG